MKLSANINLDGIDWIPIGQTGGYSSLAYFCGTFNGQGHTIRNLSVSYWEDGADSGADYAAGLFGYIDAGSATITDLKIDGAVNGLTLNYLSHADAAPIIGRTDEAGAEEGSTYANVTGSVYTARIGKTPYATLAEAVAAAPADGKKTTITLLRNASGCGIIVESGKNIVFDFGGHSYSVDKTPLAGSTNWKHQCFQLLQGSTVTFENGEIKCENDDCTIMIQNYADLTLDGITLDSTKLREAYRDKEHTQVTPNYTLSNNNGIVLILNCTIKAAPNGYAFDVCDFSNYPMVQVYTINSTIEGLVEVTNPKNFTASIDTIDTAELLFAAALLPDDISTMEDIANALAFYQTSGAYIQITEANRQDGEIVGYFRYVGTPCTLTFDPGEGEMDAEKLLHPAGAEINLNSYKPTRSGYRFDGWYNDDSQKVSGSFALTQDTTLTARWSKAATVGGGGSSTTVLHPITVADTANGSVAASAVQAAQGNIITLTLQSADGYVLRSIKVFDANSGSVALGAKDDGIYTFTIPGSAVTVQAAFAAAGSSFTDVSADSYFKTPVDWAKRNGVTGGTSDMTFSPNLPCTRAQAVTFLFRCAALFEVDAATPQKLASGFADAAQVPAYALSAMNWALSSAILQGSDGSLLPNDICTRAHIVTFLYRMINR